MKKLTLLMILSLAVFAFANCGENAANTATNSTTANNSTVNKAGSNMTPANSESNTPKMSDADIEKAMNEDISGIDTTKPMPAGEFYDKFTANEGEWKDKKVAVNGKFAMYGTSASTINTKKPAWRFELKGEKGNVACISKDEPKEKNQIQNRKDFSKDVYLTMKGVTRSTVDAMTGGKAVVLEPCEIVKMEEK